MRVVVSLEHHFARTPDGAVWTQVALAYPVWERHLAVFDQVQVIARVRATPAKNPAWQRADGNGVSFIGLPDYVGPMQYLAHAPSIALGVRRGWHPGDAVILRVPSAIGSRLAAVLNQRRHPYAVNVVGDPYDVFAPGVVAHPLRVFWRWWYARQLRLQCANASAAAYVTRRYLQRRYPCPAYTVEFSDVELGESAFVDAPRAARQRAGPFRLITVASLAQLYKAPDVLIRSVARCRREGLDVELVIVGDGKYRSQLEAQARDLGLASRVHFLGQLTAGAAIRAQLDRADIFVLPSRTEGLPRAMLEAMARAMPCIGSTAGGMPELLPAEDLVPPGDAAALARLLGDVLVNPERRTQMSKRSFATAGTYRMERMQAQQLKFLRFIRECTEAWIKDAGRMPATVRERPV